MSEANPQKSGYRKSCYGKACAFWGKIAFLLLPVLLLVFLTFLGALIFHITEEPGEIKARRADWNDGAKTVSGGSEFDKTSLKWTFWGSFAYAMSVYTTVGYPFRVPATQNGRTATVLYFLFVFPTYLVSLYILGKLLSQWALWVHSIYVRLCCCWRQRKWKAIGQDVELNLADETSNLAYVFPLWSLYFAFIAYFFIAAAIVLAVEHDPSFTARFGGRPLSIYVDALWYFFLAMSTLGMRTGVTFRPESEITLLTLTIVGFVLLATTLHLMLHRIDAIKQMVHLAIEDRYKRALVLGAEGRMPLDDFGVKNGIRVLFRKQPLRNRFWFLFLSPRSHRDLADHWKRRACLQNSSEQTRESSFEARMYGIGSTAFEFRKSRDDVNSLVAMLDTSLRPHPVHQPSFEGIQE